MTLAKWLIVPLSLLLLGAGPATQPAAKLPEKLQPFVELSRLAAEYEKQVTVTQWRETWRQTFDAATGEKWLPPAAEDMPVRVRRGRWNPPTVKAEKVDDRECAVLDASDMQDSFYPLASGLIRGEFAIQITGKALSDRPCDLSISCTSGGAIGPAFEFGAHWNKANFLRVILPDGAAHRASLPRQPLIEPGKWHTVRLDVRGGKMTGSVDGVVIGTADTRIDADRAWQPNVYIYQSKVAIDEIRIESNAPSRSSADADAEFAKVFGQTPRQKVAGQIEQLVELLGDSDYRVREGAHTLLKPMGSLAREALQMAADTGAPEQASRAQQLLGLLPPVETKAN